MYAIYEPTQGINDLLFEKVLQVSTILLVAFLFILIPVSKLIFVFIKNLQEEKESLKYSQTYISKVFNNTFDAIFVINTDGLIEKMNLSAKTMFGYSESELIGKNIKILVPKPHKNKHDEYIKSYVNDGHSTIIGEERELFAIDKNKNKIPITLSVTTMELDETIFFIGAIRDNTKLKIAQEKQREQEMMLLQQSKFAAMGEMLSAIAHQWRQPLNAIGLIVQDLVSAQKYDELDVTYGHL